MKITIEVLISLYTNMAAAFCNLKGNDVTWKRSIVATPSSIDFYHNFGVHFDWLLDHGRKWLLQAIYPSYQYLYIIFLIGEKYGWSFDSEALYRLIFSSSKVKLQPCVHDSIDFCSSEVMIPWSAFRKGLRFSFDPSRKWLQYET